MTTTATDLIVAAWPDCAPRLLRPAGAAEDYADYVTAGGYRALDDADALLEQVDLSGLLGRGGAAFPLGTKLRAVRDAGASRPATPSSSRTAKRASRRRSRIAGCFATGRTWCSTGFGWPPRSSAPAARTCTSPTRSRGDAVEHGAGRTRADGAFGDVDVSVVTVEPGYVAGEETAAVRRINGGPAKPTDKPPRPFEEGVSGLPTMVSNVETLANLPYIHAARRAELPRRSARRCRRARSSPPSPAPADPPTLYEIPARRSIFRPAEDSRSRRRHGARRADGRLLRRPGQHRHPRRDARPRDDPPTRQRPRDAARSRSSPTTARSPSPPR